MVLGIDELEISQHLARIKLAESDVVEPIKIGEISNLDEFSEKIRIFFIEIYEFYKKLEVIYRKSGVLRIVHEPRTRTSLYTSTFVLNYVAQLTGSERLHRMDVVASVIAGVGIIVAVISYTPAFQTLEPLRKILLLIGTALVFAFFSKPLINAIMRISSIIPRKGKQF